MSTATAQEPPVKTPEQIAEEAKKFPQKEANEIARAMLFGNNAPKPKTEPAPDPAKPAAADPPPAPAPKKPAKKPAAKAPPQQEPRPDTEDIVARAAEATGQAVADALKPREPEKPAAPDETAFLNDSEKRRLPVLERMEAMFPDRYKGLKTQYLDNLKAVAEYQAKWEKENPGEEFDPEDKAHNDFYAKHAVDWDDQDEREAHADMVADRRIKEVEQRTGAKFNELERANRRTTMEPAAFTESKRAGRQLFTLTGNEFKGVINEQGQVNAEEVKRIETEDPLAAEIVLREAVQLEAHAAELYRLMNDAVAFDQKNPMHKFLGDFATRQEQEVLSLPKAEQVTADGKKFATTADFAKMPQNQRAKHWTLSASDLNNLLAAERAKVAREALAFERQRIERLAPKYGFDRANGNGAPEKPAARPATAAAPVDDDAPKPVSTGRSAIPAGGDRNSQLTPKKAESGFVRDILGIK